MKDGIQTYEFKFKFNAQDSKKQLKLISNDVLQMIHNMDTASNKMKVFTHFVGYLEKLDVALDQFKADHKDDFSNLFGDVDSQLAKSLESALGLSPKQLGQLSELRSRIDGAFANKANTEELRKIAQDINALFDAIGRPAELDIDGLFSGKGNLNERVGALNNALYKFYLQYQLITNSIQNGFASGGMQGFSGMSEEVQKEVKRLSDAYDELITVQQKLQKAQNDIDKIHTKNNKKVVEQYKIELNEESVSQLMTEFDLLNAQLESGDSSSKDYYENLLKMTDVILKLNSALKTIRDDKSLLTAFQGMNVGGGYSHMFDKLSKYTTQKATQFENNFLGKTLTDGMAALMLSSRTQIEKLILGNTGKLIGGNGTGNGSGGGDGDGEKQISLYKQLTISLKEYKKAYEEYKALEDSDADETELEEKGDQLDEIKEKIYQLVDLSEEASDQVGDIFNVYENGKYSFDQLIDELTKVLGITKEINEEGSGKKLKTYEELLKIVDQLNVLGLDVGDLDDNNIQKLISDLKELYATEEQLDDVDDILSNLISGDIEDTTALKQLAKLFGIQIPESINTASQKYEDFINKINKKKSTGLKDEFDAGQYLSEMEQLKNELQVLRDQGRITEGQFDQLQKTFSKDVKGYVDEFIGRSNILKELNKLNQDATLTDDKESLEAIVQKRREILATAEQNGVLLDKQLADERAITDEIEKRIGMQGQGGSGSGSGGDGTGTGTGTGTGSGSGEGSGSGSDDASEENEQYQRLLGTIRNVEKAVNDKTAAFVHEKETVDDVAAQEIESLSKIAEYLETIRTAAQDVFGTKQGIVNSSVKEWQQALESIYNTMQSISNMQSVEEMLSRMASNALDIRNNLNASGDGDNVNVGAGSNRTETITNVDFSSLEGTIKTEISSLISKLDNVLKVEVVKSDAEDIKATIADVKASIDNIATRINDYKSNAGNTQQMQIDVMKNNLLQLQKFVSDFNNRMVDSKYQQQEITGAILSDGSISLGYGEKGEVPWDRVASSLVANLTKSMVVDLHSHPLKQLSTGQMYANDAFSGSSGDLSAFSFSKELGAKLAAEITGNVMRVLDISKLPATDLMRLSDRLKYIEQDYAKRPEYSNYIVHEDGKIKYNQQSTLQGQHKVTQILESMMYDAFKHIGYSKDKVDKEIFKKYDLTDDAQLTELASKLVQISNASQEAIEPLNRLKQIVSLFDGNLGSSEAKTAFDAFTKGELSAADVFNKLNGKGYKISQETMDSLFRINSANEVPAVESLLNQVTGILNTISSSVSSIDGKIKTNAGTKFDYALNDLMEFNGLNDTNTEITKRITSAIKSKFDPSNVSEYKAKELSLDALNRAEDLIKNFEYVESKNGQIGVERTQVMLDNFVSTLRAMEDAMNQVDLYRDRTGKKVLNDQGKNIEDDLVTTFYATFNKTTIQAMKDLLARGKEKWQAQKDSYGNGVSERVDPIAQNIDSLTVAISELQTVVSGLQQYIASPQFAIKADTSALEESLSNASTEINTSAQRIADAVNEFGSRASVPVEHSQVSIDSHEIAMAMKEALYAKEFASNYAKVEFQDVMDYDWRTDEYSNSLTGELIGAFEEADRYFEQNFSNFYKSLDGYFIGTKELAFEHLIQNKSNDNDFATVIVQAIQDQTGKIVNAIKVVLPDNIGSNRSSNGELVNEDQIANAFKIVAQRASNWSNNNWSEPRDFFQNILDDSIYVNGELEGALKTLGMMSSSGVPNFKVASEGLRNLGVAIGQDFALPSRPIDLDQVYELMPLLNEAEKLGAAIPRIVSYFKDADRVFELQTKMKGSNIASSFDWLNATVEQIDGFIHTLEVMDKVGLYPDFIGDNVLFDANNGFSLVDIETEPLRHDIDSAEDMGNWFMRYVSRMDWDDRDNEFEGFMDLFRERLRLPSNQRLVNASTVSSQRQNVTRTNNTATTYGVVGNETEELSGLADAVNEVKTAVEQKTDAFEAEGASVNRIVENEIAVLKELSDVLDTIQTSLQAIFGGNLYDFGSIESLQNEISGGESLNAFQEIQQTLGQILTVLQGFTGLESDGENSLKRKEPVVDNGTRASDINDDLVGKLNDLATEGTLVAIKDIVSQLADIIKANSNADSNDDNINASLNTLIGTLSSNITSLKEVMDGVVVHQKAQKSDTKKAMARIQDPKQNQIISGLAKSAVDSLGDEAEVESLQALANGLVKVEGAFKNAEGLWQGFTVKINEHNEAVDLAVKNHSSFARLLNKGMPIEDDNPFVFSKEEVEKRARKHLDEYSLQGKNATVQFKDSGRYTITILEEIDGLSKQIFQTFDENDKKIERTTVTMSNSQKMKLDNLQKKLIENGLANDLISDKDSVYNEYQKASDELNNMTITYSKLDDISEDQINQWKQQIKLVQDLGAKVEDLVKQRKLANDQKVFESDRSKKLSKFDLDKANLESNIDMSKLSEDVVNDIAVKRSAIENATDAESLKIAINNWEALQNQIKATAVQQDLYIKKTSSAKSEQEKFDEKLKQQKISFAQYQKDIRTTAGVADELKASLDELGNELESISNADDLSAWEAALKSIQAKISRAENSFKSSKRSEARKIMGSANSEFDLLGFKENGDLTQEQQEIVNKKSELAEEIEEYNKKIDSAQNAEIDGIRRIKDELDELVDAYKKKHNIVSDSGNNKKGQAYGLNQLQTFRAKYKSLVSEASNLGFSDQAPVVSNLVGAYEKLKTAQSAFVAGEDKTTDVYARKVEVFKDAQFECNKYARELNKAITSSKKLEADSVLSDSLSEDFIDDDGGRQAALKDFVKSMYGSQAAIGDFDKKFNELSFTVKNSDGTLTQMTATINQARTAIYATAGATKEMSSGFKAFANSVLSKFKSIIPYLTASFGWQEIWQQVRQGVQYVREIDSALTELKKVTNETDVTYDRFLKTMSKTAGVVGSTVSELTTMSADWARLGYSIEEAGKLAESTAILLNVSEFQDATSASEALISTMQAFQYTADDSQHVVDILNEVGNNYAVSSDGIATALQDSASALMEAGNNLEQSVALVAAANKVVQDPNSVGSALRTISLRLRGTSVEVLEELGEETDGAAESISKMQAKLKALTGVDILTDSGAYKDTYTILKEIAAVWEDMDPMDQAAALELMAGKNRANTLAAILNNMDDLEGAYESALGAEGSAMRENERYLESLQGHIDTFNNSLQTMWMNLLNTDALKWFIHLGDAIVKIVDHVGVLTTAFTVLGGLFVNKNWGGLLFGNVESAANNIDRLQAAVDAAKQKWQRSQSSRDYEAYQNELRNLEAYRIEFGVDQGSNPVEDLDDVAEEIFEQINSGANNVGDTVGEVFEQFNSNVENSDDIAEEIFESLSDNLDDIEHSSEDVGDTVGDSLDNAGESASEFRTQLKQAVQSMMMMYAVSAAFEFVSGVISRIAESLKETRKSAEALNDKYEESSDKLSECKSELRDLESEFKNVNEQIDELTSQGTLSYADQEELERLQGISAELERQIALKETLKGNLQVGVNSSAVNAGNAYLNTSFDSDKTKTERQDEAEEEGKFWGKGAGLAIGTAVGAAIALGVAGFFTGGATWAGIPAALAGVGATGVATIGTSAAIGAASGELIGGAIGSASEGSKYNQEQTVEDAINSMNESRDKLIKARDEAYEAYVSSPTDADKMKEYEATAQALSLYDEKMADHITQMSQYYNTLASDWDSLDATQQETAKHYGDLLDKYSIAMGGAGAKNNALDRIFGENASEEIQALEDQITKAIENGNEFDFEKAVGSSQELKDTLEYIGLDTEDVKDYFTQIGEEAKKAQEATSILSDLAKTLDSIQSKYDTLQGAIDEFNECGAISGETLKSLIDNNLLQYLTFTENGLIADANAMQALEEAAINEAYAMLNAAMVQDMENYALGKTEQMSTLARNAIGLAGDAAANAGAQAEQGAQGFLSFASAVAQAGIIDPGNLTAGLQEIYNAYQNIGNAIGHTSAYKASDANKGKTSSAKEIDWIEHYYTKIENTIDELNARLENKISNVQALDAKNTIIDQIIDLYDQKQQKLANAVATYDARADYLFSTFSSDIQRKINNGSLDISSITDEKLASNIDEYYNYIEAASQARVEAEELKQSIADLAKQKFDNISTAYENEIGLVDAYIDALQDQIDATEARGEQVGASYYESMIDNAEKRKQSLEEERDALQSSLDEAVKLGQVEVGSDTWYEMVNAIHEVDSAIVEAEISMEEWQTAINDLHWENFDKLISKLDGIASELDNIYERFTDNDEAFDENGDWTNQGIAALGVLTQKMEQAQFAAQQYADQINELNADYAVGKYSEEEYNEKLAELTEGQWESIEAYEAVKDEIVDLNKARVDAVKDGMQKELDAYKELIDAKKESLEADKKAHDWAKQIAEKEQNIADIQRKLAALASDNSTSANAQKKKLQAELLKAQAELDEAYYDKSIEDQQNALDKEYESYEENQQKEMDSLEEWLDDREAIIKDSFDLVKENTQIVYDELLKLSQEYGIQISDEILAPWLTGKDAVGEYKDAFTNPELNAATSEFMSQLDSMKSKWEETADAAEDAAQRQIDAINAQKEATIAAQNEIQANTPTATDVGSMGNVGYDDSDSGSSGGSAGWGSGIGKTTPVEEIEIPKLEEEIIEPEIQEELDEIQSIFDKIKEKAPEVAEKLMQEFSKFFNETLPNAWNTFWEKVGAKFTELGAEAEKLGSIIGIFFTETVPEKWNEFWNKVGIKFEELGADAQKLGEAASIFFTQTIPEKWNAFWTEVGQILTQDIPYAIGCVAGVVYGFFSVTLPEAWAEFWDSVDTFLNETLPAAYEELKNKLNAFWNEVIVSGWHEFWDNVDIFLKDTLPSYLEELKNELNTFWNETIVANWHEFWDNVSIFLHKTLPTMAEEILNSIHAFWNKTIVGGWYDFWDSVDVFINETIPNALAELDNRIKTFWNETVVEGWHEFWDNVDTAFFAPIQTAFINICNDISAFFSGIPGYISGMWNDVTRWISEQASTVWDNLVSGFTAGFRFITGGSSADGTANVNGTAYKGGTWGAPKTETSLVGELGPEILVRNGKWTTVGENGAEFTQVKKGDIIFNHKQSEQLLKNGHVTGRGKAYASGTWKNISNNLDDLGEELTMCIGPNGGLQFLSKGADAMAAGTIDNFTNLAQFDATDILNRSRPSIGVSPSAVNNTMELKIDASVGELIHVDNLNGNNLDEIGKFVDKAWEKKMQTLNNSIKKFTR